MKEYNTTEMHPEIEFAKHVFHRERFSHYLRWTYVLKISKLGNKILDFGCGSGNLAEVLYRNMHKCDLYLGLDIRERQIELNKEKFKDVPWISFEQSDLVNMKKNFSVEYGLEDVEFDIITCFEVLEHVGKQNVPKLLENIKNHCTDKTVILISTPNYDENVGAANNHIYNGQVNEWKHNDLQIELEKHFIIEKKFGTFASIKDYKHLLNDWQTKMFDSLKEYYDSNLLSVIMAPMFPEQSRNCLWVCRRK